MKTIIKSYWLMAFVMAILPTAMVAQVSYTSYLNNGLTWHYQDTIVDGVTYRDYSVDELAKTCIPEYPQLPKQVLKFSVPYNAHNIAVNVTGGQSQNSSVLPFKIIPVLRDRMICDTLPDVLVCDSAAYHTNALYPASAAELVGEGYYMGENHIVTVAVYPMQYNPVTNKLRRNNRVNFTITYDLASDMPGNVLIREDQSLREEAWNDAMAMVMNPTQVESFAPVVEMHSANMSPILPDTTFIETNDSTALDGGQMDIFDPNKPCEYMIVTTRNLAHSFRRLAALKRQKGYSTEIYCIEDILNDYRVQCGDSIPGALYPIKDDAGKLRQFLRYAHKYKKTKYVLFGGHDVPFRYGYHDAYDEIYSGPFQIPTDWYYTDLTTNWNPDNRTDNYGEFSLYNDTCIFDVFPELYVGRLLCKTPADVDNYTDKLFIYELNPGKGDFDYLLNGFYFEGYEQVTTSTSLMSVLHYQNPIVYRVHNNDTHHTGKRVIDAINSADCGFLAMYCHGNYPCFDVSKKYNGSAKTIIQSLDNQSPIGSFDETGNGLDNLLNPNKPGIIYSVACDVIPFDKPNENSSFPCNLGESYTQGKNYGGIAFLGNTRKGFRSYSIPLGELFGNSVITNKPIGISETKSKMDFAINYSNYKLKYDSIPLHYIYQVMVHNLLGDPEVIMRTTIPQQFQTISANYEDSNIYLNGIGERAWVSYCNNNGRVSKVSSNSGGYAHFENMTANASVTIYNNHHLPFFVPLAIQNTSLNKSQYVIVSDFKAGNNIDSNRTSGDVTIKKGAEYEVDYSGEVLLAPGFTVEHGATFSAVARDY